MTGATDPPGTDTERLRALWSRDLPAYGLWSALADPVVAELLGTGPFDYLCLDLQHGFGSLATLPTVLGAMRAGGRAPLVRVPWNEPAGIMRALDSGAAGVVVPMVSSPPEAAAAAAACRFPPDGSRSWGPFWGDVTGRAAPAPQAQDDGVLCLVMVETAAGLAAVEEIARVPGVDGIYVGPNDLALTTGHGRTTYRESPEIGAMVDRVVAACGAAGIVAGLHCSDVAMAAHWAQRGVRMLTVAQDSGLLRSALRRTWRDLDAVTALSSSRDAVPLPDGDDRSAY